MKTARILRRLSHSLFLGLIMALTLSHFSGESASAQDGWSSAEQIAAGNRALAEGMYSSADLHFRQGISLACDESNIGALATLSDCFVRMNNFDQAARVFDLGVSYAYEQKSKRELEGLRNLATSLASTGPAWFQDSMRTQGRIILLLVEEISWLENQPGPSQPSMPHDNCEPTRKSYNELVKWMEDALRLNDCGLISEIEKGLNELRKAEGYDCLKRMGYNSSQRFQKGLDDLRRRCGTTPPSSGGTGCSVTKAEKKKWIDWLNGTEYYWVTVLCARQEFSGSYRDQLTRGCKNTAEGLRKRIKGACKAEDLQKVADIVKCIEKALVPRPGFLNDAAMRNCLL